MFIVVVFLNLINTVESNKPLCFQYTLNQYTNFALRFNINSFIYFSAFDMYHRQIFYGILTWIYAKLLWFWCCCCRWMLACVYKHETTTTNRLKRIVGYWCRRRQNYLMMSYLFIWILCLPKPNIIHTKHYFVIWLRTQRACFRLEFCSFTSRSHKYTHFHTRCKHTIK